MQYMHHLLTTISDAVSDEDRFELSYNDYLQVLMTCSELPSTMACRGWRERNAMVGCGGSRRRCNRSWTTSSRKRTRRSSVTRSSTATTRTPFTLRWSTRRPPKSASSWWYVPVGHKTTPPLMARWGGGGGLLPQARCRRRCSGLWCCVAWQVGAGRGPLVRRALMAGERASRAVRVYAVEKNPNAVVTLRYGGLGVLTMPPIPRVATVCLTVTAVHSPGRDC